jgi:hypothetical protein
VIPTKNCLKSSRLTVLNGDVAAMATADAATANTMHVIRRKRIATQKDISISDTKKNAQIETGLVQQTVQIVARCAITI